MLRRLVAILLVMMCIPVGSFADETTPPRIINMVKNKNATYQFKADTPLLEIVFPRVYSSDCAIIRFGDETMMVDASTKHKTMTNRIKTACDSIGVDHVDIAYNSHPHDDHVVGFQYVYQYIPFDQFYITFPEDANKYMKAAVKFMNEQNVPITRVGNGDVITMGENDEVTITIIQNMNENWPVNDQSAMLMIRYGERRFLLAGDNENRSQKYYTENPPACGINADIFKYPHHGQVKLDDKFLKAIDPQLIFLNGATKAVKPGVAYCKKKKIDHLVGYDGLTRMRTDGEIWVVDYVQEIGADRKLPYTKYQGE